MKILAPTFAILLSLASFGCGPGTVKPPPYANVTGKVSFNGKPIDKGTITFSTDGRPPSIIDIADGKFSGQAMTGSNKVSVSYRHKSAQAANLPPDVQSRLKNQGSNGPMSGNPNVNTDEIGTEEMIPPDWGASSKQVRVVEAGAQNTFEFDIKGKQ